MKNILSFTKNKEYLICVDSDGCVMDTMNVKHTKCFGPRIVDEWKLHRWEKDILLRWNEINLYTITRGINRFKGLAMALSEINEKYTHIEGIHSFVKWTKSAPELSNTTLSEAVDKAPCDEIFKKALSWSIAVNKSIDSLPEESKKPFPFSREALEFAARYANIAIISSANYDAIINEWQNHNMLKLCDVITSQSDGSKDFCISRLLIDKGFDPKKVIMCGDAPGDLYAAEKCGVYFYPILVGKEKLCWLEFVGTALPRFFSETFSGYANEKRRTFFENLGVDNAYITNRKENEGK